MPKAKKLSRKELIQQIQRENRLDAIDSQYCRCRGPKHCNKPPAPKNLKERKNSILCSLSK